MPPEPLLSPGTVPRISYAPHHEDILLDRIFGDHVGTFMDVGARGPTVGSTTYFFYQRGWRGTNLEPVPGRHAALQAARPGDLNLPLAAWDSNGEIPLFEVVAPGGLAAFTFREDEAGRRRAQGLTTHERRVPVRTIRSLVEELEIDPPDFLVIDAEGAEEHVIRGIPLERWCPRVIVASARPRTTAVAEAQRAWEPVLLAHGYLFAAFNGVNRFYLRGDLRDLRSRLETPVSILDRFERADVVAAEERWHAAERQILDGRDRCARLETERADAFHERIALAERLAILEARLERAEQGRDSWKRESEALRHDLTATQRYLRPYRLIDQLGVVSIGYRWARRFKPNRAS